MTRRAWVAGFALAFGMGAVARADDEKKPESPETPEKTEKAESGSPATVGSGPAIRFTGFVHAADLHAEVVKATDSSVTVRIYYPAPSRTNNRGSRGSSRPSIGAGGSVHPSHRRNPRMTLQHHDYTFDYHPDGLARVTKLPPKADVDGKKVDYTNKEMEALREPVGFPGYSTPKTDLRAGDIVDLNLVRDRSIPQAKQTDGDLKVKWAKVTGHVDHTPPAAAAKPAAPKKKN